MATTTYKTITYVSTGQKEKEVVINEAIDVIDGLPEYLGSLSTAPTPPVNKPLGTRYYNTTDGKFYTQTATDTWTAES